ncbi:hypothetical protein Trco_001312 [Trichoderma cornu-damae]|uniref:Uncharacterized protein n=1 Tax=Trichoderma cornu-damae TaxID=654480 RepID=A0A9P8QZ09_9HYPO|nr:hypothetical protein Trco_001312 [Trichoderma cornu-damae]
MTAPIANRSAIDARVVWLLLKVSSVSRNASPTFSGRSVSKTIEASRPPVPADTSAVDMS